MEEEKKDVYQILRKDDMYYVQDQAHHLVLKERCDNLIQIDLVIISEIKGKYKIYIPGIEGEFKTLFGKKYFRAEREMRLHCVAENVAKYYYFESENTSNHTGILLIKSEEYWIPIIPDSFSTNLTVKNFLEKKEELPKIKCIEDEAKVNFITGFDEYFSSFYIIEIGGKFYLIRGNLSPGKIRLKEIFLSKQ